jgi:hypothetical protein
LDFTFKTYKKLLKAISNPQAETQTLRDYILNPLPNALVLRHDVDLLPANSLRFAREQKNLGIKGTYYFRAVPQSWNENIIKQIASMGHEIGYHYETMDTARGNTDKAWDLFRNNLHKLRQLTEVHTVCMHGSPRSTHDNRDI